MCTSVKRGLEIATRGPSAEAELYRQLVLASVFCPSLDPVAHPLSVPCEVMAIAVPHNGVGAGMAPLICYVPLGRSADNNRDGLQSSTVRCRVHYGSHQILGMH